MGFGMPQIPFLVDKSQGLSERVDDTERTHPFSPGTPGIEGQAQEVLEKVLIRL